MAYYYHLLKNNFLEFHYLSRKKEVAGLYNTCTLVEATSHEAGRFSHSKLGVSHSLNAIFSFHIQIELQQTVSVNDHSVNSNFLRLSSNYT